MAGGEDLDAYFDPVSGMGVAAIFNGSVPVNVVLDNEYNDGGAVAAAGTAPRALGKAADFPLATSSGKTLQILTGLYAGTYTIRPAPEPINDGEVVSLRLKR